jgi:hypothetical protein
VLHLADSFESINCSIAFIKTDDFKLMNHQWLQPSPQTQWKASTQMDGLSLPMQREKPLTESGQDAGTSATWMKLN